MSITPGYTAWKLAFQLSPIILTGGALPGIMSQVLPMMLISEAINLPLGLLSSGENVELDNFFANFQPLPGATLVENEFGRYPFANQSVAANAVVFQPKRVSMLMHVPANNRFGYFEKLAIMELIQSTIALHNQSGGTYTVLTPSFIYTNCVMKSFHDVTSGASRQVQQTWQIDFEQPLLTTDAGAGLFGALNSLYSNITQGLEAAGNAVLGGVSTTIGGAASAVAPFVSGTFQSQVASVSSAAGQITTTVLPPIN